METRIWIGVDFPARLAVGVTLGRGTIIHSWVASFQRIRQGLQPAQTSTFTREMRPRICLIPSASRPKCPADCPGGEWRTSTGYHLSLFLVVGGSYSVTSFTCAANGKQCIGQTICRGAGAVASFSPGLAAVTGGLVAGATDSRQLEGVSFGYSSSVGAISGNFTFTPTARSAYDFPYVGEVGLGKSYGAGIAFLRCETKLVGCLR